jgi:hypothetical protein
MVDPDEREGLEDHIRSMKQQLESVGMQEQQARNRDAELSQMLDLEENRWADLIARLEQLIKR